MAASCLIDPAQAVGLHPKGFALEVAGLTRKGTKGETVRVEILRGGDRLVLSVPRGPLGLRMTGASIPPTY